MSQEPAKTTTFWTFLIHGMSFAGSQATVTGWFVFGTISAAPLENIADIPTNQLTLDYLTPPTQPISLDLTHFIPAGTKIQEISASKVVQSLVALFKTPFTEVPKAPLDIPIHRVPPSQREKLINKLRQQGGA